MKRRSARPFMVEFKNQPRTGRVTRPAPPGAERTGATLWRGVLERAMAAPVENPPAAPVPLPGSAAEPIIPAPRRILPNLMPLAAPAATAEEAEAVVPVPRRRGRPRRTPSDVASTSGPVPKPVTTAKHALREAPNPLPAKKQDTLPTTVASRPRLAPRRPDGLRPGERWKRRLSRFAR